MSTYMHIDVTDTTATKETEIQFNRSKLPVSDEVRAIDRELEADPSNCELWMRRGIALSKQMLFKEAVESYSKGLSFNPFHALTYRHRGHRYLSIRCFEEAAADFALSARLDDTNWDTWYHLGLSYYLLGDYKRAAGAYRTCLEKSDTSDKVVAVVDWYWMTAKRLGDERLAEALLKRVDENTDPGENLSYKRRILMYKGLILSLIHI